MPYRETERTKLRRLERRAAIVTATRTLVSRSGLGAVSIEAVAAEAGIATGTVYRYFAAKDDLIAEVIAAVCRRELDLVARIAGRTDRPATHRMADAVACFGRRTLAGGRTAYAVIAEPSVPEVERLRTDLRRDLAAIFASIVSDGVARGELPPQPSDVVGMSVVGAVSEVLVGPVGARPGAHRSASTVEELVALVLRAIGAQERVAPDPLAALGAPPALALDGETDR